MNMIESKYGIYQYHGKEGSGNGWFSRNELPVLSVCYGSYAGRTLQQAKEKIISLCEKYPLDNTMRNFDWTKAEECN